MTSWGKKYEKSQLWPAFSTSVKALPTFLSSAHVYDQLFHQHAPTSPGRCFVPISLETRVFVQLGCNIYLQTQRTVIDAFLPANSNECKDAWLLIEAPVFAVGDVSEVTRGK
jgi:hypothetical protein